MLKIRALNRDSLSDEDAPTIRREAQEEIALDLYNNALRLQCNENLEDAEGLLQQLLQENIPQLESQGGLPKTMSTIKYSCYVNLGSIAKEKGDLKTALESYLSAAELDKTDVTLWHKIGKLALQMDKFRQAAYAFSQGLECSESHWPCLDQLITLLYAIRDTIGCLFYITKALVLDPDYIRGLVLRKQIYESNPATREYYQLYNPDYILEPDLDSPIDESDEKECIEDVQKLCDRINEVEQALAPKPLPCIPLPTPLEEFTWLALGRTLTDLHRYISDNGMSHFCKVDLSKAMSQTDCEKITLTEPISSDCPMEETKDEVNAEVKSDHESEIKADEQSIERRMSMNSENNGDVNDSGVENLNSSQAEDNDEMDQDTEDQEENSEQKNDKKRGAKRRRDLLLDLQIWGWHSKRKNVKKGKSEKDLTVEDALKRIIPSHLRPSGLQVEKNSNTEDSMNTMDMYKMFVDTQTATCLSPIPSPVQSKEEYFGSQEEKDDVLKFWTKEWECCDAVSLIEEYVYSLASLWHRKWPPDLVSIYIAAYHMYREHFEHPQLFSREVTFEELKNDALATLLYGELFLYQTNAKESKSEDGLHPTSLGHLQLLSTWEENWADDYVSFFVRVHWLRAHIFRKSNENYLAIRFLHLIQEAISSHEEKTGAKFRLCYFNCEKYVFVSAEITEKLLRHLEMIDSLSRLEQLYNSQCYMEVAEILETTFLCIGNPPTCGRMGRPAQLGMLMDSLWYINRTDCFIWTEKCLHEAVKHFVKPLKDQDKWELVLGKCLDMMHELIKEETVSIVDVLSEEQRHRLIDSLCRIVCHQLNVEGASTVPLGSILPWIVMHYVLVREEHRAQARNVVSHVRKKRKINSGDGVDVRVREVPPSIAVLFSAHEFLGPKSWCLTSQGQLLHFIIDTILDRLDTPIFEPLRDKIDIHLEQAFFCLYQHPSKKNKVSRHLADHNVNPLPLVWERAHQLYEFYCPDALPEFDSFKSISISSDLEQLLQRIIALVPAKCDPQPLVSRVSEFVNGNSTDLPDPKTFPNKIRAAYYLLGDYFFKQNEVGRSVKYFLLDLSINPTRLDTWADLALGIASQLEGKLNHCERFKSETEFLDKAKSARACFKQALKLMPNHVTLWIEFGAFEYMVHSFCSRVLKYESDTFSMEKFEVLESQKESYLDSSGTSFTKALDLYQPEQTEADERWLHHYMLGKVAEKRRKEPVEYLQHYLTAAALLDENNATYPDKIHYHNPQHLSVEALEIHYRIHASVLKYLELHEGKNILSSTGRMFKKCLDTSALYETTRKLAEANAAKREKSIRESEAAKDDFPEIVKCVEDMLTEVENREKAEKTPAKDVVAPMDTEDDKAAPKSAATEATAENVEAVVLPKVKVRNVQDIMDAMMRETMATEQQVAMDTDSDGTNVDGEGGKTATEPPQVETEKNQDVPEKVVTPPKEEEQKVVLKRIEDDNANIRKSLDETTTTSSTSSDSSSSDSDSDDSSSSSSSSSSDITSEHLSDTEVLVLVDRCIVGLEKCMVRFPQNYKALYRLVHLYLRYSARKDINRCRQLLLSEYKCKNGSTVSGLFSEHKTNNFFNGVWRIPSSEIDRPGSLAAHMARCVTIFLQVLRQNNDHKMLLDVCLQLRRTPDSDKIYIRHAEREQLSEQALSLCIQSLKAQIKNITTASALQRFLMEVFRAYQRIQKHIPQKEGVFATMLSDIYKKFMQDKVPENLNVLDLAVKFCQQYKVAEKLKQQQQKQNLAPPSAPLIPATPPVLPTPPSATPSNTTQPLKRPSLGRPRGRPPGPKQPGLNRSPRGRPPLHTSSSLGWPSMMYDPKAMNYMMQYQEELLRQYTALSKMTSMSNFPNQFVSQFGMPTSTQASLLSPSQLVQAFSQMTSSGLNSLSMNQFSQSLARLNPSLLKKLIDQCTTPTPTPAPTPTPPMTTPNWASGDIFKQIAAMSAAMKGTAPAKPSSKPSASQAKPLVNQAKPLVSQAKPLVSHAKVLVSQAKPLVSQAKPLVSQAKPLIGQAKPLVSQAKPLVSQAKPFISQTKPPASQSKPTYTTAGFSKNLQSSTFKYANTDMSKPKLSDLVKPNLTGLEEKKLPTNLPSTQADFINAANILSDRPNLTITPVTQPTTMGPIRPTNPLTLSTSGKTLQEKLADKQKQHTINKNLSFDGKSSDKGKSQLTSTFSSPPSSIPHVNLPSFPLDSGISISQLHPVKATHPTDHSRELGFGNQKPTAMKKKTAIPYTADASPHFNLPPNMPLSVSVIKKPEDTSDKKDSSDDDVIIIE